MGSGGNRKRCSARCVRAQPAIPQPETTHQRRRRRRIARQPSKGGPLSALGGAIRYPHIQGSSVTLGYAAAYPLRFLRRREWGDRLRGFAGQWLTPTEGPHFPKVAFDPPNSCEGVGAAGSKLLQQGGKIAASLGCLSRNPLMISPRAERRHVGCEVCSKRHVPSSRHCPSTDRCGSRLRFAQATWTCSASGTEPRTAPGFPKLLHRCALTVAVCSDRPTSPPVPPDRQPVEPFEPCSFEGQSSTLVWWDRIACKEST